MFNKYRFIKVYGLQIHESVMINETGYLFTTLESATFFIEQANEKSFPKIPPEEYQKYVK